MHRRSRVRSRLLAVWAVVAYTGNDYNPTRWLLLDEFRKLAHKTLAVMSAIQDSTHTHTHTHIHIQRKVPISLIINENLWNLLIKFNCCKSLHNFILRICDFKPQVVKHLCSTRISRMWWNLFYSIPQSVNLAFLADLFHFCYSIYISVDYPWLW